MSVYGIFLKSFKLYSCNNSIIILEYMLGYLFDKYYKSYYDIYNKKKVACNGTFTCYVDLNSNL
ncbi:hypothetical protein PFUGPA_00142 [Plasmodium falciparum Palo Alto/Uganda]|nr:hypothetical protein PFUGPA_00142 [Plasmodium falciparum Palo Alto/Uganda]